MEYKPTQSYIEKRSTGMAITALVFGIIGTILGLCPYVGFVVGSLAIILGLLSRGGEMTMSIQAKIGVVLGSIGIGLSCIGIFLAVLIGAYTYMNQMQTTLEFYDFFYEDDYYSNFYDFFDDNGRSYSDDWYNDFELDDTF